MRTLKVLKAVSFHSFEIKKKVCNPTYNRILKSQKKIVVLWIKN